MKSSIALLIFWTSVLSTVDFASGLKCEDNTGHTCTKSLHVTETCREGQCECEDGYFPTPYGCQEVIKTRIEATATQGIDNGHIQLKCSVMDKIYQDIEEHPYHWYKDGVLIENKNRFYIYLTALNRQRDEGIYTCSHIVYGVESLRSDPYNLTFVRNVSDPDSFVKPVLTNVPEYYVEGMRVKTIKCVSNLAYTTESYTFYVAGQVLDNGNKYSDRLRSKTLPKTSSGETGPLSCSYTLGSVTVMSDDVPYPQLNELKLEILGSRYASMGSRKTWYCITTQTPSLSGITPRSVQWYKDGNLITASSGDSLTKSSMKAEDAGVYTCTVSRHGAVWVSSPHQVETVTTSKISITPSAPQGFNETTLSLECDVTLSTTAPVILNWYRDGKLISGHTDNVLHVYDARSSEFECHVGWPEIGDIFHPRNLLATVKYHT